MFSHKETSHAPRERVSWNSGQEYILLKKSRHAPRERVSWNLNLALRNKNAVVTLHVSVWVEIDFSDAERQEHGVTLHVSVWVEIR